LPEKAPTMRLSCAVKQAVKPDEASASVLPPRAWTRSSLESMRLVRLTSQSSSSSAMRISKMSCNRYKRSLYLAAQTACRWDLEMAAFYHKKRKAGHTHKQAVCAVANGKLLPGIHSDRIPQDLSSTKVHRYEIRPALRSSQIHGDRTPRQLESHRVHRARAGPADTN
jgi:hypothetical protein